MGDGEETLDASVRLFLEIQAIARISFEDMRALREKPGALTKAMDKGKSEVIQEIINKPIPNLSHVEKIVIITLAAEKKAATAFTNPQKIQKH